MPTMCWCSVTQLCPTLCNPMDCCMPGFPVLHHLTGFAQTHVLWVGDAMQPPFPLSSLSPPALNLSQHQSLVQWVGSSYQVVKKYPKFEHPLQHQSFQWIFSLLSFRIDRFNFLAVQGTQESSPAPQFESINSLMLSLLHGPTLKSINDCWKNHSFDYVHLRWQSDIFVFSTLSRFVIVFLSRSNCLLISLLQSLFIVILELRKIKSITVSIFPHLFTMMWWDQMLWC